MKRSGADILRLWVAASDYADDLRIGPEILKTTSRPTASSATPCAGCWARSAHYREADRVALDQMPELERLMLHRLAELDAEIRRPTPTTTTSASSPRWRSS